MAQKWREAKDVSKYFKDNMEVSTLTLSAESGVWIPWGNSEPTGQCFSYLESAVPVAVVG